MEGFMFSFLSQYSHFNTFIWLYFFCVFPFEMKKKKKKTTTTTKPKKKDQVFDIG